MPSHGRQPVSEGCYHCRCYYYHDYLHRPPNNLPLHPEPHTWPLTHPRKAYSFSPLVTAPLPALPSHYAHAVHFSRSSSLWTRTGIYWPSHLQGLSLSKICVAFRELMGTAPPCSSRG